VWGACLCMGLLGVLGIRGAVCDMFVQLPRLHVEAACHHQLQGVVTEGAEGVPVPGGGCAAPCCHVHTLHMHAYQGPGGGFCCMHVNGGNCHATPGGSMVPD
jgi:hypothetical protein